MHHLGPPISAILAPGIADSVPRAAIDHLLRAADEVLEGRMTILGVERSDLSAPDWFYDPVTTKRAPSDGVLLRDRAPI